MGDVKAMADGNMVPGSGSASANQWALLQTVLGFVGLALLVTLREVDEGHGPDANARPAG